MPSRRWHESVVRSFVSRPRLLPFSAEYVEHHRAFVSEMLDSPTMIARFAASRRLPRHYGVGLDERVVEYPWLLAQRPRGRVLDAGSTLNHSHILDRFLGDMSCLHVVTLAPEDVAYPERGVSYVYSDLRELPFRDGYYETVLSVSTLEHVGMDNTRYRATPRERSPRAALHVAVTELRRVLVPGGTFLITVPYGAAEDHVWFRQFDKVALDELVDMIGPSELRLTVYAYSRQGWQLSSLTKAAGAQYRDSSVNKEPAHDLATAARAVACIRATC